MIKLPRSSTFYLPSSSLPVILLSFLLISVLSLLSLLSLLSINLRIYHIPSQLPTSALSSLKLTTRQLIQSHRAHAVPGGPYTSYDHTGSGVASIYLNGQKSHSHYYDINTKKLGWITSYKWTVGTTTVCSRKICPKIMLPIGTHKIKLNVKDNSGDVSTATTTAKIIDGGRPNIRILYYRNTGLINNGGLSKKADYSETRKLIDYRKSSDFLSGSLANPLSIRVIAELDIDVEGSYAFKVYCGPALCSFLLNGVAIISFGTGIRSTSHFLKSKAYKLKIVWLLQNPNQQTPLVPSIILEWRAPGEKFFSLVPKSKLSHRPGSIQPVINSLSPLKIKPDSTLTIIGSSFVQGTRVLIGGHNCRGLVLESQFRLTCEVDGTPDTIQTVVVVTPRGLRSNSRRLKILSSQSRSSNSKNSAGSGANVKQGLGYQQRVHFEHLTLRKDWGDWYIQYPTAVTHGPDGRFYFATRNGIIYVTEIDDGNVKVICSSRKIQKRAILGLAFNPADPKLKLYATTSILDFPTRGVSKSQGWRNGEIVVFEQKGNCMEKTKTIISGLPVSAFDHSVNKVAFDNNGLLFITVGSSTNAGIPSGKTLNLQDSILSAAVLTAPVMKQNFNGHIQYSNGNNPFSARKIGGDVSVYATGVRNSYGIIYHSNGNIYATDNGGNEQYGDRSTGCNSQKKSQDEVDKLLKLSRGGFYGAANRARGGRECVHYMAHERGNYDIPIATMEAATTAILEYTANTFGGGLRSDLLLGQIATSGASGKLFRVQLAKNGVVKKMFELTGWSGADMAMSGEGNLIMPRVYENKIVMLKAIEKDPGIIVVTSVWPCRGRKIGGNKVTVTGWGLKPGTEILIGGKTCINLKIIGSNGRKVKCIVPPGSGKVAVIAKIGNKASGTSGFEYMYMNI